MALLYHSFAKVSPFPHLRKKRAGGRKTRRPCGKFCTARELAPILSLCPPPYRTPCIFCALGLLRGHSRKQSGLLISLGLRSSLIQSTWGPNNSCANPAVSTNIMLCGLSTTSNIHFWKYLGQVLHGVLGAYSRGSELPVVTNFGFENRKYTTPKKNSAE